MFINYVKIAVRNFFRHKSHSVINIVGLAIGIAACLLLLLWVQDELSYDRYHENVDRIYRVVYTYEANGKIYRSASTPAPLGPALVNRFPWIKKTVRFSKGEYLIQCQKRVFYEQLFFADPEVFDVFSIPLVSGDPKTALKDPSSVLISEDIRLKYFGDKNPIGQTIFVNEKYNFKITGVFKNIPHNSHFRFNFLIPFVNIGKKKLSAWGISNNYTYILAANMPPSNIENFDSEIPQFIKKYRGSDVQDFYKMRYILQPLSSIHLHSNLRGEIEPNREISTVAIFVLIALFILIIACINYINLSTAGFLGRTKEAGLRKVLGANSGQLISQFLSESFLFAFITLPLALLLAEISLPMLNALSGKILSFGYFENFYFSLGLICIFFIVGLGAGIVPAIMISSFSPIGALREIPESKPYMSIWRKGLVIFQFCISTILIIVTMSMFKQIIFMTGMDLGFNKSNVVNIHMNHSEEAKLKYETIKNEFLKDSNVLAVSATDFFPGRPHWNNNYWIDGMSATEYRMIGCIPVDYEFFDTFEVNFLEGRGFSREFSTDLENGFILNEAAVKEFGWQSAIGKNLNIANWKKGKVVGVINNFHFNSSHHQIAPLVFYIDPPSFEYFYIRIKSGNIPETLRYLENKWQELVPGQPFDYSFLDEDFNRLYGTEMRLVKIFMISTLLSVLISCMGLWGLASFSVQKRMKEVAVRKVLGASRYQIVSLLSREFVIGILISNFIAWPIAWFVINKWLQNFAYRSVSIPIIIIYSALSTLAIAMFTVSFKAIRASSVNLVKSLKYE